MTCPNGLTSFQILMVPPYPNCDKGLWPKSLHVSFERHSSSRHLTFWQFNAVLSSTEIVFDYCTIGYQLSSPKSLVQNITKISNTSNANKSFFKSQIHLIKSSLWVWASFIAILRGRQNTDPGSLLCLPGTTALRILFLYSLLCLLLT